MKNTLMFLAIFVLASFVFASNEAIKPDGEGTTESPYLLTKVENLIWMGENIAECQSNVFRLENDIDASETIYWKNPYGWGLIPIGSSEISKDQQKHNFSGVLDGQGFAVKNLYSVFYNSSLFRFVVGGNISNLKIQNACFGLLAGDRFFPSRGILANNIESSTITNVHVTGKITGIEIGGFAYNARNSSFVNCSFNGKIKSVLKSDGYVGGLIGICGGCYVSHCQTAGIISCTLTKDENLGEVCIGGLFGEVGGEKDVVCCYSDMQINSKGYVGGLAGANYLENYHNYYGYITTNDFGFKQCYSNCTIEKQSGAIMGGLAGFTTNSVCFDCYYNSDGASGTVFGMGVNSAKIKQRSTFTKWDFSNVWGIDEGQSTPYFGFEDGKYLKVALLSSCFGQIGIEPEKDGYAFGETVTITASPEEGSEFQCFGDALTGEQTPQTLVIEKNTIVVASFAKQISSIEMFAQIGEKYPDAGNYVQVADFDLSDVLYTNVISMFSGVYDGRNHCIRDWKQDGQFQPLFKDLYGAELCNLNVVNLEASYFSNSGVLATRINNTVVSNCYISFRSNTSYASGAFCGSAENCVFSKCLVAGEFYGDMGNFSGLGTQVNNSSFDQCGVEIYSENVRSDFCGAQNSRFINCFAKGDFSGTFVYYGFASNCYLSAEGNVALGPNSNYANCYFSSNCVENAEGITGIVSPEEMTKQETYVGWDFENVWDIEEGVGTPYFRYALPEPVGMFALLLLALMAVRKR
ncbi:hypothetical protein J6U78_04260 [bacterium]|nr:hypothetical protein [bacterium]